MRVRAIGYIYGVMVTGPARNRLTAGQLALVILAFSALAFIVGYLIAAMAE
jgi:hypothetical protein